VNMGENIEFDGKKIRANERKSGKLQAAISIKNLTCKWTPRILWFIY